MAVELLSIKSVRLKPVIVNSPVVGSVFTILGLVIEPVLDSILQALFS